MVFCDTTTIKKTVAVFFSLHVLSAFSVSKHCDTYGTCQVEVTQFLSLAVVAIVFLNKAKLESFS